MTNRPREQFARSVCFFLAEMLRTREVSLHRAADIAGRIVMELDRVRDEDDFLLVVKDLEREFQVLKHLEKEIEYVRSTTRRATMEKLVREYAVKFLPDSPEQAVELMQDALLPDMTLDDLMAKYDDFAAFVQASRKYKK